MSKCKPGAKSQKFDKQCGAFVHVGHDKKVFEVSRGRIVLRPFGGFKSQLWHYKEFVRHSKCSRKRHKVMKFHGQSQVVVNRKFFSMPTEQVSVAFWMKATSGTAFSYTTKHMMDVLTVTNPKKLVVYILGTRVQTPVNAAGRWTHIAVSWDAKTKHMEVHKNGKLVFSAQTNTLRGKKINAGGCAVVGQRANKNCAGMIAKDAFNGEITDVLVWRGASRQSSVRNKLSLSKFIRLLMYQPVPPRVLQKLGKLSQPYPKKSLRWALLSRQYSREELGKAFPPTCKLQKHKRGKKVTGPGGHMKWGGHGDVHYSTFSRCYYDDQSVGEWEALRVVDAYKQDYPLKIQFRTSPQRQRCSWCQNGAVSYIDGCAVQYGRSRASAGFGGFNFPHSQYKPYAAFNGKPLPNNRWRRDKNMRVRAYVSNRKHYGWGHGNFQAYLTRDAIRLRCCK
jgi:hypothetical protein